MTAPFVKRKAKNRNPNTYNDEEGFHYLFVQVRVFAQSKLLNYQPVAKPVSGHKPFAFDDTLPVDLPANKKK